jgi:hypothetical protein
MNADKSEKDKEKTLIYLMTTILGLIIILSVFYLVINEINIENQDNFQVEHSSSFPEKSINFISSEKAWEIINKSSDKLYIIDCRSCKCNYDNHSLNEDTIYIKYAKDFINSTAYNFSYNILVYDNGGINSSRDQSRSFCLDVYESGKTDGIIYCLENGINEWKSKGYPIYYKTK